MDFVRLGEHLVRDILDAYANEKQPPSAGPWAGCRLSRRQLADRFQVSKKNIHEILGHPDPVGAARDAYHERKEAQRAEQFHKEYLERAARRAARAERIITTPLPTPEVEPRVQREIVGVWIRGFFDGAGNPLSHEDEWQEMERLFAFDRKTIAGVLRDNGYAVALVLDQERDTEPRRWNLDKTKWSKS